MWNIPGQRLIIPSWIYDLDDDYLRRMAEMPGLKNFFDENYPIRRDPLDTVQPPNALNRALQEKDSQILKLQNQMGEMNKEFNRRLSDMQGHISRMSSDLSTTRSELAATRELLQHYIDAGPIIAKLMGDLELDEYDVSEIDYVVGDSIDITRDTDPDLPEMAVWRMKRVHHESL